MYPRVFHSTRQRTIIISTLSLHCMLIRIFVVVLASLKTSTRVCEQIVLLSSALGLLNEDPASIKWLIAALFNHLVTLAPHYDKKKSREKTSLRQI